MQVDWKRLAFYLAINAVVSVLVASAAFLTLRRIFPSSSAALPGPTLTFPGSENLTPGPTSRAPVVDLAHLPTVTPLAYVVESGDTLGAIALKFDIAVEDLMAANGLTDPDVLEVGQTLIIPVGGAPPPATSLPLPASQVAPFPTATRDPNAAAPEMVITQVIGAGDLQNESVRIANLGGEVNLAGWVLEDVQGNRYTFPALTLHRNGAVTVHTVSGTNSVIDLYWGASQAVWQVGETVTLRQADNVVHATYTVR